MAKRNRGPFGSIALCLSGGGYRAAAYHLGVFSYLNRAGLLENVSTLSTVSGGTIVGAAYTYSLQKADSFETFFKKFQSFLLNVNLVRLGLDSLGQVSDSALGYHDLVCSLADVYDRELFSGAQFGILWNTKRIHLQDIIFNATEFKTGIAFRFQKSRLTEGLVGNGNISISTQDARQIRLGDIVAASSCFPGGFEPLAFPHDFKWPGNQIPATLQKEFKGPLPLMDGGVYDNQGIDSAVMAIERSKIKPGLFIISDTTQPREEMYAFPKKQNLSKLSLGWLNLISIVLAFLSLFSFFSLSYQFISFADATGRWFYGVIAYGFPALVLGALTVSILWVRAKIKGEALKRIPKIGLKAWNDLKRLSVDQVADLLELRITSLFSLASSVFMKRIRSLVFQHVYENKKFDERRISNLIYKLTEQRKYKAPWLQPSDEIRSVAGRATDAPTTLWFENNSDLRDLVSCGQFSTCHNLLDFIIRKYGKEPRGYPSDIRKLFENLKKDWLAFNENPFALLS